MQDKERSEAEAGEDNGQAVVRKVNRLALLLACVLLVSTGTAALCDPIKKPIFKPPPDPSEWSPPVSLVARIDAMALKFKLPKKAASNGPLSSYTRYYIGRTEEGRKIVIGLLVPSRIAIGEFGETAPGQLHIRQMPAVVMGGGCDFINVRFDLKADKLKIECNAPK